MTGSLAGLRELIRQRTGIHVPDSREAALAGALRRSAPGFTQEMFLAAVDDPVHGSACLGRLVDEITVQETFFLRDQAQLGSLPWHSLRRGSAAGGPLRVWSAGCASGEEAYSLALLASEAFAPAPAPVRILGTDISGAALASAARGRYGPRAMRELGPMLRQRYLERQPDGTYLVRDRLRELVGFRLHNLALDPAPPPGEAPFDLIVCRNVLIYFEPSLIGRVTTRLERALRPGGRLILGAADTVARTASAGPAASTARPRTSSGGSGPVRTGTTGAAAGTAVAGAQPASRAQRLVRAMEEAGRGRTGEAQAQISSLLAEDPLDADANFAHGLVALDAGDPAGAAAALRAVLYTDPAHTLAAFTLGRAYDALGDRAAANRAYAQALRTLDPGDRRHEPLLQQVDLADIAAACRARLGGQS